MSDFGKSRTSGRGAANKHTAAEDMREADVKLAIASVRHYLDHSQPSWHLYGALEIVLAVASAALTPLPVHGGGDDSSERLSGRDAPSDEYSRRRPMASNADDWLLWLEEHADSERAYIAVQIVEAIEEHQKALAREVYGLAEDTAEKYESPANRDDVMGAFARGRITEAQSIARAVNAIMPYSRDPASLSQEGLVAGGDGGSVAGAAPFTSTPECDSPRPCGVKCRWCPWKPIASAPKDGSAVEVRAVMRVHHMAGAKFSIMPKDWRPDTPQTEWRITEWREVAPQPSDQCAAKTEDQP